MDEQSSDIRTPAVAGRFYPASPDTLRHEVQALLTAGAGAGDPAWACGVMAPHAGYVYSGGVAGQVFSRIRVPGRVVILCPNHTGAGARVSVWDRGVFSLPGVRVPIDDELARAILAEYPAAEPDRAAHLREHAIEVEVPFLHARQPDLRIVPIVVSLLRESDALGLGRAIHRAVSRVASSPRDVLVVASSDMSHYLPDAEARRIDHIALEPLLAFDPCGLYQTVVARDISMCGFIPATAMLAYAREQTTAQPRLVGYATSGDAFGDRSRVVGYAGVVVSL